jgi:hypothetical protein
VKDLRNYLAALKLQEIGVNQLLDSIKAEQRIGIWSDVQAKRRRDMILKLARLETVTQPSEALVELDRKVTQAATLCR